jgi:2-polyprenyl-3-methyl-5-hydroxy-6-metoxy-1,4-benzoquinol methylase
VLEEKYKEKTSNYYANYRSDILPLLPKHSSRALEIGCGTGSTLAYLKENGYCDWTCGIDLFPDAIQEAALKLDLVHQCNVEEAELPIERGSIDLILCLDVLEHLVNPQKVVAYLHTLLTPGGALVASIPNVRHRSVVLPLIFQNKWEYKDCGVLDNTHLRFFVKNTAIELMKSSGLKFETIAPSTFYGDRIDKLVSEIPLIGSFFTINYLVKVSN